MEKSKIQAEVINNLIIASNADANYISDGYHTFGELYEHRLELYITLCRVLSGSHKVWKSRKHSDNSEYEGWFIMGINIEDGKQITYHLPECKWVVTNFAKILDVAPNYDGHSSCDVLDRLSNLSL